MAAGSPRTMTNAYANISTSQPGPVKKMAAQADTAGAATLATLIADFNSLLAKLRSAGMLSE